MAFLERFRRGPQGRYSSLSAEEGELDTPTKTPPAVWKNNKASMTWKKVASHSLLALLGIAIGLIWRDWSILFNGGYIPPSGNTPQVWYENHTFIGRPTINTQKAWEELVPKGKGFVYHPQLASPPKAVAAYHQLHCLHGIRIAYYTRLNEIYKLQHKPDLVNHYVENMGANVHLYHLDHCFEYLRQALMCAADSNLEDLEVDNTGQATAPGWGTKRTCRDYDKLFEWSRKWRASEDDTIL